MVKVTPDERRIGGECADRMAEIATRAKAKGHRPWWEAEEIKELTEYGPRYMPGEWFGEGEAIPEKHRVRLLRAIRSLATKGLLQMTTTGGRLTNIQLTAEGLAVFGKPVPAKRAKPKPAKVATEPTPGHEAAPCDAVAEAAGPSDEPQAGATNRAQ